MTIKEAEFAHATHRFYPTRVRFVGLLPHGKHTRDIAIDVDPELICGIADAIRATRHTCAVDVDGEFGIGHAMWHVHNPDALMPCLDFGRRGKVIDVHTSLVTKPVITLSAATDADQDDEEEIAQ